MGAEPMLELRGLRKSFGGLLVIDDLDLSVVPGEIVSVIGPRSFACVIPARFAALASAFGESKSLSIQRGVFRKTGTAC